MPRGTLTLAFADREVELSREHAAAVADYLWKGLHSGSVTSAAKLTHALAAPDAHSLSIESYEAEAVHAALEAVRLPAPRD